MFWGTIHRMILIELLKIFIVALIALTGIILLAGIISEAMKNGFGPAQILACIPLLLPSLLPYTVPTTTLFATCIVYGRLSADNEILALKAAGVHILHVVWPALLLGLVTSAVTMAFYIDVIPITGCLLRNQVVGDVEDLLYTVLRNEGCIKHPKIGWEIHVKNIQGRKLQDVILKRKTADGTDFDTIVVAKEAELRVDLAHNLIRIHIQEGQLIQGDKVGFIEGNVLPMEIPEDFAGSGIKTRAMDMTWSELIEREAKCQLNKQQLGQQIDVLQAENSLRTPSEEDLKVIRRLMDDRHLEDNMIFSIHAEWHMRPALSFGCLCFALVGCPIGIWFSKSDYLSAFITCFLPIVVIYYPLMFCMFDLARAGKIPPWMSIFNADALLLLTGGFLFWRLARN